jgi:toxin YoeB
MTDTTFAPEAFAEYIAWQNEDKKTLKKINDLIRDIHNNGFLKGTGKPEFLKYLKCYSRRIDDANRLLSVPSYL